MNSVAPLQGHNVRIVHPAPDHGLRLGALVSDEGAPALEPCS